MDTLLTVLFWIAWPFIYLALYALLFLVGLVWAYFSAVAFFWLVTRPLAIEDWLRGRKE